MDSHFKHDIISQGLGMKHSLTARLFVRYRFLLHLSRITSPDYYCSLLMIFMRTDRCIIMRSSSISKSIKSAAHPPINESDSLSLWWRLNKETQAKHKLQLPAQAHSYCSTSTCCLSGSQRRTVLLSAMYLQMPVDLITPVTLEGLKVNCFAVVRLRGAPWIDNSIFTQLDCTKSNTIEAAKPVGVSLPGVSAGHLVS